MEFAPIAIFTYNRPDHTRRTIEALLLNKLAAKSRLIIFSDGPKNAEGKEKVRQVRNYIHSVAGFESIEIIEREKNFGLGNNIIDGVTQIINRFGKIIVLEDDLVTSPFFLDYMNSGLSLYEMEQNVISIHGYVYPVKGSLPETFFLRGADCLGWATWKRGWDLFQPNGALLLKEIIDSKQDQIFNFQNSYPYSQMLIDQVNGKNNSWAIRWYATAFLKNMFTLYPGRSLINHIGSDGTGTNSGFDYSLDVELNESPVNVSKQAVIQNIEAYHAFIQFFRRWMNPPLWYRFKRKAKRIINNGKSRERPG